MVAPVILTNETLYALDENQPSGKVHWKDPKPFRWDNSTVPETLNEKADGFHGIWYSNQPSDDEYVYKYSGGLGTYCAKHRPFAIYRPEVNKTFFCYGGRYQDKNQLLHMVSFFDHKTGMVARPTILLDKATDDAHDNPVISMDAQGYLWIFSSSHGTGRPSFIHRSGEPYSIDNFEWILTSNFSYTQPWFLPDQGFLFPHTIYGAVGTDRTLAFTSSSDGFDWKQPEIYAAIEMGHYQVTCANREKVGVAFNMHPSPKGLNWRTNLYYMQTPDLGQSWYSVDGKELNTPLTTIENQALVHDYLSEGRNVYMKDISFDEHGHPVILYIVSYGYESGPENGPRIWHTARWTGEHWEIYPVITSDNNYDMGSLFIEEDTWRVIAPTEPGPQKFNPGGEIAMYVSDNKGWRWSLQKQLTESSRYNHTYVRRVVNGHPEFYALWADGHGRKLSDSHLYFTDREGAKVRMLPQTMKKKMEKPESV